MRRALLVKPPQFTESDSAGRNDRVRTYKISKLLGSRLSASEYTTARSNFGQRNVARKEKKEG